MVVEHEQDDDSTNPHDEPHHRRDARATHSGAEPPPYVTGTWTAEEHDRFLVAMATYPLGPWSAIAEMVGTRSVRQVHSHAQKYAAKMERHKRGQGKVKRSRAAGEQGCPTGHRVVPRIPGKFVSSLESSDDEFISSEINANEHVQGRRSSDWTAATPRSSGHAPAHDDARAAIRFERDQWGSHLDLPTISNQPEQLPSLDDSLDFFIHHFEVNEDLASSDAPPR